MFKYDFCRDKSIKNKSHFNNFFLKCKKEENRDIRLFYNEAQYGKGLGKYGFVASKKIGCAVKRNYSKRILREILRKRQYIVNRDFDIVLSAKKNIFIENYQNIEDGFTKLLIKCKLLEETK